MEDGGPVPTARLYTRAGDDGSTGLLGGARVAKSDTRVRAYGAYDELGAHLGRALAELETAPDLASIVRRLQHELFSAMSELATAPGSAPPHRIGRRNVERIERDIDALSGEAAPLRNFVLPGGDPAASELHIARTVARRAERELVALHQESEVSAELLAWSNRVGDLLFALALAANRRAGIPESAPDYSI